MEVPTKPRASGLGLPVATFFLAGTMAGSGVLALAKAMVGTGPVELPMLAFFALASAFVGVRLGDCLVILEERFPEFKEALRDPYPAIAEKAAGQIGRKIAVGCINFTLYGGGCVFLVLMGNFITNLANEADITQLDECQWMAVVAVAMIPLCWLGTPNDFWPLAIGALATTVAACLLTMIKITTDVKDHGTCYYNATNNMADFTPVHSSPTIKGFFNAFSSTMFAFAGAPNFPTIQSDMRDRKQFTKAVMVAMFVLLLIYSPMASVGYFVLGDAVEGNMINSVCDGTVKIVAESLLLLHLVSAFPIVVNPSNQFFEGLIGIPSTFTWKRCVFRSLVVGFLLFVSASLPDFGSILDLVGGSAVTMLTFIFPPFFYIRLVRMGKDFPNCPQRTISTVEWIFSIVVIVVGVVGGVSSTVVAVINIVATNFHSPCYISN